MVNWCKGNQIMLSIMNSSMMKQSKSGHLHRFVGNVNEAYILILGDAIQKIYLTLA